jgi:hypothetical protein
MARRILGLYDFGMDIPTVRFVAEYEDGSKETFDVYRSDLRTGDHVARVIAGERQRESIGFPRLKPGNIVRVYREGWELPKLWHKYLKGRK